MVTAEMSDKLKTVKWVEAVKGFSSGVGMSNEEAVYWVATTIENNFELFDVKAKLFYFQSLGITNDKTVREYLRSKGYKVKNIVEGFDGRSSLLIWKDDE